MLCSYLNGVDMTFTINRTDIPRKFVLTFYMNVDGMKILHMTSLA